MARSAALPQRGQQNKVAAEIKRLSMDRPSLNAYHQIGSQIRQLGAKYGRRWLQDLAIRLKRLGVDGMNMSTLWKCRRLSEVFTYPQIQQLQKAGVSWRAASRLTSSHLKQTDREQLIKSVVSRRLDPTRLGKAISGRSASAARMNRRSVVSAADRAVKGIMFLEAVVRNKAVSEDLRRAAKVHLRQLNAILT
jgi:hypothetical protein